MKVIIAGSRDVTDYSEICKAIEKSGFIITEVVSGKARGVDSLGEAWASENNIPIKYFPANWTELGIGAGYKRNFDMRNYADALIAVWNGYSKGTVHMINISSKYLKVYVHLV